MLERLPIIGILFKSKADRAERTELMVLITPRLVRPLDPDEVPPLPTTPGPFLPRRSGESDGRRRAAGPPLAPRRRRRCRTPPPKRSAKDSRELWEASRRIGARADGERGAILVQVADGDGRR